MANCPGNNIWLALMAMANTRAPITRTQSDTSIAAFDGGDGDTVTCDPSLPSGHRFE